VFLFAVTDVEKKWSNLRTQFLKEFKQANNIGKSGSAADVECVKWRYYRPLLFLSKNLENRQTVTNLQVVKLNI